MNHLLERIKANDPTLKEIRLTEAPEAYCADMNELIDALGQNTIIDYVRLDRDFLPCMEEGYDDAFFKTIGRLPSLTEAHIWYACIPVTVLAMFIREATKLEFLDLGCLDLGGTQEDFKVVAEAIRGHPTLTGFSMSEFSLYDDTVVIAHFVETLATIPHLQHVKLEVIHKRRRSIVGNEAAAKTVKVIINGGALATLCRAPNLRELTFNRLNLNLDDFEALAEAIKTAPNLKSLALPHCNLSDQGADHIAKAIGENQSLEKLDFSCNALTDEGCITIATALKENKTVKMLRLWGNIKISNAGFDALVDMLASNCTLERVPLMAPMEYRNKIDTRLMQNSTGTKKGSAA